MEFLRLRTPADPSAFAAAASDLAWQYRWAAWSTTFGELTRAGWSDHELLFVTYASARRLQFAYAHAALTELTEDALSYFPGDEFLTQLNAAGRAVTTNDARAWTHLVQTAQAQAEAKYTQILLAAAVAAKVLPGEVLEASLTLARSLAVGSRDVVGAYRVATLLRRAGRWDEAFDAVEDAYELLATTSPLHDFAEHISERLLTERNLIALGREHSHPGERP